MKRMTHQEHIWVAEIMACCDPDPQKRKEHRLQKLSLVPENYRARVRELVNERIKKRSRK